MLYREDEQFKLMPLKATYKQHGKEHISYVAGRKEMEPYEEMGHISELSFEEAAYSSDQLNRLKEAQEMPASQYQPVEEYALEGTVLKGSMIEVAKERENLELSILGLSEMMMGVVF